MKVKKHMTTTGTQTNKQNLTERASFTSRSSESKNA